MRDLIAERKDDFARVFSEALIAYGVGRSFGFTDEDFAVQIMTSAKKNHYAVAEFIYAVVESKQFQSK